MKYFFVLGNNPTLSIAELVSILKLKVKTALIVNKSIFLVESDSEINCQDLIKRVGGSIKIGVIEDQYDFGDNFLLTEKVEKIINTKDSKFRLGFSIYGNFGINLKKIGMIIKNNLKEKGINSRILFNQEQVLSSVSVEQNKLLDKGAEIVLIRNRDKILIGRTLAVQAFKELSRRDYGRPARDDLSGMIPPKLAQIMINLAGFSDDVEDKKILDPFCGSGTILMEAMLLGFKDIIGFDISKKAIQDSGKNASWTEKNFNMTSDVKLKQLDVVKVADELPKKSIDAIITEPYLGPQRGYHNIEHTVSELEDLYFKAIKQFSKILKPDGIIVMVWPIFIQKNKKTYLFKNYGTDIQETNYTKFIKDNFEIKNLIPGKIRNHDILNFTDRDTIVYGREGQRVWREIVVLKGVE